MFSAHVLALLLVLSCQSSVADAPSESVAPADSAASDATLDEPETDAAVAQQATNSGADSKALGEATVAQPTLGAHTLAFYRYGANDKTSITSRPMAVQATGSTVVVGIARGDLKAFALPTGNTSTKPFVQLGATHNYTRWLNSGTASYALTSAILGKDFTVSATTVPWDEITMAAIEVRNSTKIQAFEWNEVLSAPLTSRSVTTTGPATLIAFWWGDGSADTPHSATPNNGFTVVDSLLEMGGLVQCSVAIKSVSAPGTYSVTWTATPAEGAQLWLIAVQ